MQTQHYLTTKEAAELLRTDPQVITREAHRGTIRGYKFSTRWLFTEEDLRAALKPNTPTKGKR